MKIAIIGSGNVGAALARQFIKAGHKVLLGVRFPLSAKSVQLATHIGEEHFGDVKTVVKESEVIVLAVPPDTIIQLVQDMGDVSAKTIIDTTNSIRTKPEPYATAFHALKALTKSEHIVKCFNSTGFENMLQPDYNGVKLDMFCAGSDKKSKELASQLAKDIGFETCYDFGGDDKVDLLEKFALSWINLAILQGHGRNLGFKLLKR